jgi:hypothetical protein
MTSAIGHPTYQNRMYNILKSNNPMLSQWYEFSTNNNNNNNNDEKNSNGGARTKGAKNNK